MTRKEELRNRANQIAYSCADECLIGDAGKEIFHALEQVEREVLERVHTDFVLHARTYQKNPQMFADILAAQQKELG